VEAATAPAATQPEFTGPEFRSALGSFTTGVTVITTRGEDHLYGMTANAFSSVSLEPPLVLVCVISGTEGAKVLEQNSIFAVNILGASQEAISRYFASRERPRGLDAFREVPHGVAITGAPILEDIAGFLDCRLHATHEAGDHVIFIGEVVALGSSPDVKPLLFSAGKYRFVAEDD
jgi:flavin reductase (DIM6/NTAB) family NADH-FMN oxidoreductase RutF